MIRSLWALLGYVYYPSALSKEAESEAEVAFTLKHLVTVDEDGRVEHRRVYRDQVPAYIVTSDDLYFTSIADVEKSGANMGEQRRLLEKAIEKGYTVVATRTGSVEYIPPDSALPEKPPITCLSDLADS